MQNTAASGARDIVTRLPEMGPNKIQQALDDYDHMVSDLAVTKKSLAEYVDIANKLQAENDALKAQCKAQTDFLTQQLDAMTAHRDRLNAALQGYIVRYRVIRQTIEAAEREALELGLAEKPAGAKSGGAGGSLPPNKMAS